MKWAISRNPITDSFSAKVGHILDKDVKNRTTELPLMSNSETISLKPLSHSS